MDLRNKIEKLMIESSIGLTKVSSHLKYRFIQPVSPLVSIIIVTFNNIGYTRFCISSIYTKTFQPGFELIIVDNASTDGTKEYLYTLKRKYRNVNIIINDNNLGFAAAKLRVNTLFFLITILLLQEVG